MKTSLSKQLHLARIAANYTQAQLAELCQVTTPTIQSVENEAKIETVKLKTFLAYCDKVGYQLTITPKPTEEGIK
jgi:DNA-binding XRE family transcriptional regulator